MALPQVGHMDPAFMVIVEDLKELLRYVWQTKNRFTIPVSGTGSAAWEAAVANLTEPGDVHLIFINGYFGGRATDMHARYGAKIVKVERPFGEVFTLEEIKAALAKHKPTLMWIAHAETSTGAMQPIEGIGDACREHNTLFLLDTVTSICAAPIYLDAWKVDAAYAGGQKGMGCPPGIAPLTFGDRALKKLNDRKAPVAAWYLNMQMIQKYMDAPAGAPRVYHHTAPISMVYAMREALTIVAEEGLENSWARHRKNAEYLWAEFEKVGLKMLVAKQHRLPTLTTVIIPDGVDGPGVIKMMREEYQIEIGGPLGPLKCWRIGLMGYNSRRDNARLVVSAVDECIKAQKGKAKL
jgi:alanine-glyoxylate transaminase/serine-glyoxylate transaminase/serine-pyruvate transaminase